MYIIFTQSHFFFTYQKHIDECLFIEMSCTYDCGEKFLRSELAKHEANCPKLTISVSTHSDITIFKFRTTSERAICYNWSC